MMVAKAKEGFSNAGDVVGNYIMKCKFQSILGEGERLLIPACQALPPSQSASSGCLFLILKGNNSSAMC